MEADVRNQLRNLPGGAEPVRQRDGWWMAAPNLDVRAAAGCMQEMGARLSTMTAVPLPGDEIEIVYHYCLSGQAFNFKVVTKKNALVSIAPVLPAADWIEREIRDLYRVEFIGHPHPDRLIRPLKMEPGIFREQGGAAGKDRR